MKVTQGEIEFVNCIECDDKGFKKLEYDGLIFFHEPCYHCPVSRLRQDAAYKKLQDLENTESKDVILKPAKMPKTRYGYSDNYQT